MKMTTKISAAAVGLLLLFSQTFSIWNLRETQQMRLGSILSSELTRLSTSARSFSEELYQNRSYFKDENGERFWGRSSFQNRYNGNAVLYYDGEELSNISTFAFDLDHLKKHADDFTELKKYLDDTVWYGNLSAMIGETEGRRLLILCTPIESTKFELLHYRDITELYEESRELFLRGGVMALVMAAVLLFALSLVIRRILRPFHYLSGAAAKIADGDYSVRVEERGRDEVTEVAKSFNGMARQVEEHVQSLAETNGKQRRLLGALAHELKTPMTGIQGYAELLQRVELPQERQQEALSYIEQECRRLSRLSAKLLQLEELSGESEEEIKAEKKPLDVARLFAETEMLSQRRLAEKGLCLKTEIAEGAGTVEGDADLLLSLLTNLLDNAVKASAPGGVIRLAAMKEGISVSDEGKGIPPEELAKITEPFYMVDKSRSRQAGGAGLGLALCDQIARLHGWSLKFESEPGRGTKAEVCFSGRQMRIRTDKP